MLLTPNWVRAVSSAFRRRRPLSLLFTVMTGLALGGFVVGSATLPYTAVTGARGGLTR